MKFSKNSAFDPSQDFESVDQAIVLIHAQADHMAALKAIVNASIDMDELSFAADLLLEYYPADATQDPRFREQMQGLADVSASLNDKPASVVVFSDDRISKCSENIDLVSIFTGYLVHRGERVQVDFHTPSGASVGEKDAAFMAALSEKVDINYLEVGTTPASELSELFSENSFGTTHESNKSSQSQ